MKLSGLFAVTATITFCLFTGSNSLAQDPSVIDTKGKWIQLFNGKDLEGWIPKVRFHEVGENPGETFHVEDGKLVVSYDPQTYPRFNETFGHIFYNRSFSHYKIRVEYRFVGDQVNGGPGWAIRNSGIMLHCQNPRTMERDQDFPVSIEVQLLGGDGTNPRSTSNLCTPGTNVEMGGQLLLRHCTSSKSKTYHGEQWVTAEVEVHGNRVVKHIIDGEVVLSYERPQLDLRNEFAKKLVKADGDLMLSEGYISLQSESHPVEFRKVELMELN